MPASAWALTNYYAQAQLPGQSFTGAYAKIMSARLDPGNKTTYFVDNDMWIVNNNAHYWIEAGLITGRFCAYAPPPWDAPCAPGGWTTLKSLHFFWSDQRPNNGGYHAHIGPIADFNTYYDDAILHESAHKWSVSVGPFFGTSTGWFDHGELLEIGTETTSNGGAIVCSSQHNVAWYDAHGHYHNGLADREGAALVSAHMPPYFYWAREPDWLRNYENWSC